MKLLIAIQCIGILFALNKYRKVVQHRTALPEVNGNICYWRCVWSKFKDCI